MFQLFLVTTYISIFLSFVNRDTVFISLVFSALAILTGFYNLLTQEHTPEIPKHFVTILLFAVVLQIYLIFVPEKLNPFYYAVTISEGLSYWLIFYNLKNGQLILKKMIFRLSAFYSILFTISHIFNISLIKLGSLMFTQENPRHYYFGEFWSASLMVYLYYEFYKLKKRKFENWLKLILISATGVFFIIYSNSRGILLSGALATGYLFVKGGQIPTTVKKILPYLCAVLIGVFIFLSLGKTTLFDRPYFIQSIQAFPRHLLGVGMGNFVQIGKEFERAGVNDMSLSIYTHNIFLETLSGVGIFSIIFLIFLAQIIKDVFTTRTNFVWGGVLFLILANFMYSTSYTVPAFIWIFFAVLGVFYARERLL